MRRAFLLLALPLLLDQPAFAQSAVDQSVKRIRSVVIYGDDPCPKANNPDEIVVCAKRPEEERYRLPPSVRDQAIKNRKNRSWAARTQDLERLGASGTGSCTTIGPGGANGCTLQSIRDSAEEKRDVAADTAVPQPKL